MTIWEGSLSGAGLRVAIVASRFNELVGRRLLDGALDALRRAGVAEDDVSVAWVPGAVELPLVARRLAASGEVDAVVTLGAVIRGETDHYDHVCRMAASGIASAAADTGVPVIFGVLTTDTLQQALERAGGKAGQKGAEAAAAAIEMATLLRQLPSAS
jgi:6,7-dimethyl-8-ribityllumazine synthase